MSFKKIPLILLTVITAALLFSFINADDDPIKKAAAQLEKWTGDYPQEKVYLHMDKPYYAVGEDIWFKAYVTIGPEHKLSALSGILNVELLDPRDSVQQSIKLPLTSGIAMGDFALSDTLKEGNYRIRAYTNWMRNFAPEYFFDRTIHIGNAATNTVFTNTSYAYTTTPNGQQNVKATVSFTDINGIAYAGKEVSYQVQLSNRNVGRGKGVTDDKGNLAISFTNTVPGAMKAGQITAKIKISDKQTITKILPVKATSNNVDVQFFPEGGNLVAGLPCRVAFKAVGADGLGKAISGTIVNNDNTELTSFTTSHLGMGLFVLIPEAGKTYQAKVTYEDGSKATVNLPKVLEKGYSLSLNNTSDPDNITIRIGGTADLVGQQISVVAQANGVICYAAKNSLENGVLMAKIPKSKFPTGIAQFTLFNAANEPVCERIIFINREDELKVDVAGQASSGTRQKVNLSLNVQSPDGKPAISALSAAVIDETKVPSDESDEISILSQLLLSSDIKGYIEKPNYYFVHRDEQGRKALDLLMMTQGYRRFEWKQLLNNVYPPVVFQPEKELRISGHVHNGNKPVIGGKVTLFTTKGGAFILDTLTDDKGNFAFNHLVFKDSVKFIIQARTAKDRKFVDIELDNVVSQGVSSNPNAPDIEVNVSKNITGYLQNSYKLYQEESKYGVGNHNYVLKEVVIKEKKITPYQNSSNLNGPGQADQIISGDIFEKMGCPDITTCLQGRLLGVTFRGGAAYSTRSPNTPMQIVLDGMTIDDPYFLSSLNAMDIASIEVLRSAGYTSIYGMRGGGGVLVITTKRGGEYSSTARVYAPGIITYTPKGYYQARTFYSPQYDDPKVNRTLADLRTTIFWKPNIVTDKDGKASIEFYNAGSPGTYRVIVEGIDGDGHIGHQTFRYKVQ
ncbi:TonB-dependent receptor plug domain-containing protein [Mucilaginibacter sp. RS28]|uniref:TonB-dependent receptor plug domain-containing protein n=1 Tax=Mucilaginibacter straminoryzae TaxID=2932774 RepID=A0A9X1X6Q0_9SPHI|nr:TonB-dependent receptor plug domain-containing protein [Mucilaginibacter straminoryzae]MCJ8212092.1 TonB-dependent receptor plug domain-containing protein [Mucilaginibacter straminoryzae]